MSQVELRREQGKYVRVNDLNIYYEQYGNGEPLVMLHGGTVDAKKMWEKQVSFLSKYFRVITPDSRGHGMTDNPRGEISYRLMSDDVAEFIRAIGLENSSICGYSDGGQVCLEIGMNHPDIARNLVVGAAVNRLPDEFLRSMKSLGLEAPGVVDLERYEKTRPQSVSMLRQLSSVYGPDYWKTYLIQMSKVWLTPANYKAEDYRKITARTLILLGDRDTNTPLEDALEMYRLIPRAELSVVPGVDHYLPWSRPETFNNIVLDFLQRSAAS